jgi:hypothetical protein
MEELLAALAQAIEDYRTALKECETKYRPTDGLLGFGHSIKDDPCHGQVDERVEKIVAEIHDADPSPQDAEKAALMLLARDDVTSWPISAQFMLRALERHSIPLIPSLSPETANALLKKYNERYKRWERFPAQNEVFKALKARAK